MIIQSFEIEELSTRVSLSFLDNKRLILTGGTGMLGSYLIETICRVCEIQNIKLNELKVLSLIGRFDTIKHLLKFKFVNFESINLNNLNNFYGYNYVIHASSPASPKFFLNESNMTRINAKLLSYLVSKETEKLLLFSTGEIYGDNPPHQVNEDYKIDINRSEFRSSYPIAKKIAEEHSNQLSQNFGFELRIARIFHTFGPGVRQNDGRSFADFLWSAANGNKPSLRSSGLDVRTFLYSLDCIAALLLILQKDNIVGPINVGGESPMTIEAFAKRVSYLSGLGGGITKNNLNIEKSKIIIPDLTKLKSLGWFQGVGIDQAIFRTLNWVKEVNKIEGA